MQKMEEITTNQDEFQDSGIPSEPLETLTSLSAMTPPLVRWFDPIQSQSQSSTQEAINQSYESKTSITDTLLMHPQPLERQKTISAGLQVGDKEHLKALIEEQSRYDKPEDNTPTISSELLEIFSERINNAKKMEFSEMDEFKLIEDGFYYDILQIGEASKDLPTQ